VKKLVATLVVPAALAVAALAVVPAYSATACPPPATDPSTCQTGGASAAIVAAMKFNTGTTLLDTGVQVTCAPGVNRNCSGSVNASASLKVVDVGYATFTVLPGKTRQIQVFVNRKARAAIRKKHSVRVTVRVAFRGETNSDMTITRTATLHVR
jgi:hypothetical protein